MARTLKRAKAPALLFMALVALLALMVTPASGAEISPSYSFGGAGSGESQFQTPKGIAVDAEGNFWVADSGNDRVQHFANFDGAFIGQFGTPGSGAGQMDAPSSIAIDKCGNLWITETNNDRVQKFNSKGEYLSGFGSAGSGNGQFNDPEGIAIDSAGNIWVVDRGNNRVQKFNSSGTYLSQFGSEGSGNGQFNSPSGIELDAAGNLWITDTKNNRIQKFNSSGTYLSQFGATGSGSALLHSPEGNVGIDSGGLIWVSDTGLASCKAYKPNGEFYGAYCGLLTKQYGVEVGNAGSLYISVQGTNKIYKWYRPPAVPKNLELPILSTSIPHIGTVISTTTGTWTAAPNNYYYQWYREGVAISGATNATYTTSEADLGKKISVEVIAADDESAETGKAKSASTSAVAMITRYWYAGGEKLAGGTPTEAKATGTKNFVIQWKSSGINFEITCTSQTSKETTVENPAEKSAGTANVRLLLSGCTINVPTSCTVNTPIEVVASGAAWELPFEAAALKFTGTAASENTMMWVNLSGSECPYRFYTFMFKGTVIAKMNNATSSLEFTKANSNLNMAGEKATLEGTTKLETVAGKAITFAP